MGRISAILHLLDEDDLQDLTMDVIAAHFGFTRCPFGPYEVFIRPEVMTYALTLELGQSVMAIITDMMGDDFEDSEDAGISIETVWACDTFFKEKLGDNVMAGGELLARYMFAIDAAARTTTIHPQTKYQTGPREIVFSNPFEIYRDSEADGDGDEGT